MDRSAFDVARFDLHSFVEEMVHDDLVLFFF